MKSASLTATLFLFFAFVVGASGQSPDPAGAALELYKSAKYAEAARALSALASTPRYKTDAEMWNLLGMAHINSDGVKKARAAFEKAASLAPQNSVYRSNLAMAFLLSNQVNKSQREAEKAISLDPKNVGAYYVVAVGHLWEGKVEDAIGDADKMIAIDPSYSQAYIVKSDALIAKIGPRVAAGSTIKQELELLRQAIDTLEAGQKHAKNAGDAVLAERTESARTFYKYFSKEREPAALGQTAAPEPGVTPLKILAKPRASYTDSARQANVSGAVRLVILFGANGSIQQILKLSGIGHGLDEQAIRAARQIKFEPKMKDGKPVPAVATVEYHFEIY